MKSDTLYAGILDCVPVILTVREIQIGRLQVAGVRGEYFDSLDPAVRRQHFFFWAIPSDLVFLVPSQVPTIHPSCSL